MARKKSTDKPASIHDAAAAATEAESVLNFDGNLAVQNIDAARQRIGAALAAGGPIAVDLSRISLIDTAGVQLLLAFGREAASRGFALELRGESPVLATALEVLGLQAALKSAFGNAVR
jgi:anti-anti-sigma factor